MSDFQTDAATMFQTLRVLVPSRSFAVDYEVLADRFLPLVEEFLLRAVAVAGSLEPQVAAYLLGLGNREFGKCLGVLEDAGLVAYDSGGRLELSPYARERVRNADGVPRFVDIESKQSRFAVDLYSSQAAPTSGAGRDVWFTHAIEMERRDRTDRKQSELVQSAFEESFYSITKNMIRRPTNGSAVSPKVKLHRVKSVVGRQYFTWLFDVDVSTWSDTSLRSDFPFSQYTKTAEIEARRDLFAAIRASISRLVPPVAATSLKSLAQVLDGTPGMVAVRGDRCDESLLVRLGREQVGEDADPVFFVGDLSREDVLQLWRNRLDLAVPHSRSGARAVKQPLVWLPPEGGLWARSAGVRNGLEAARTLMDDRGQELVAALLVPVGRDGASRTATPQRHKNVFSVARSVNAERWPANIEVIIVPGKIAAVFLHMRPNGDCVVPVIAGFMTNDKSRVEAVRRVMASLLDPGLPDPSRDWCSYDDGPPVELTEALRSLMWEGA